VQAHTHKPATHNSVISGPTVVEAVVHNSADGLHSSAADSVQQSGLHDVNEPSSQLRVSAAEFVVSAAADVAPVVAASNSE